MIEVYVFEGGAVEVEGRHCVALLESERREAAEILEKHKLEWLIEGGAS